MRRAAAVLAVCLAAVLTPVASAAPPPNDNYLQSDRLNQPGSELPRGPVTVQIDSREATEQGDLLAPGPGGGPPEPRDCEGVQYGKTVWYDLYPHKDGYIQVTVGGFDSAIGIVPFRAVDDSYPLLADFACINRLTGTNETGVQYVRKGRGYSAQIGGTNGASGTAELQFEFFPDSDSDRVADEGDKCKKLAGLETDGCPGRLNARPFLGYRDAPGGVKVSELTVKAPKGAEVAVTCGSGCPSQSVTVGASGTAKLTKIVGRTLRSGKKVLVHVTKGKLYYGELRTYSILSGDFKFTDRCTLPRSKKTLKQCP